VFRSLVTAGGSVAVAETLKAYFFQDMWIHIALGYAAQFYDGIYVSFHRTDSVNIFLKYD
jgi:hypothetical protein